MRGITAALAAGLLLSSAGAAASSGIDVALEEGGEAGAYRLSAGFSVKSGTEAVWGVLSDYDGIEDFVSSIRSSRVLRREPGLIFVEQEGSESFFFVSRRVKLTLAVRETEPVRIDFKGLDGSQFRRYEGSWSISFSSGACFVAYELTAQPDPSLGPRFAARKALRKSVRRHLQEVRAEIERRASAAR